MRDLPPRPGEHPPSERQAEIGLPKDVPEPADGHEPQVRDLPPRPGEHPPSERRAEIGLPKDVPAKPPDPKAGEPKQTPQM